MPISASDLQYGWQCAKLAPFAAQQWAAEFLNVKCSSTIKRCRGVAALLKTLRAQRAFQNALSTATECHTVVH